MPSARNWSTFVATRCTQGSPEERAYVKREGHPSRQDGRRPTRGNKGSPTCARGGSRRKEYKTHARPELYASTSPLEALKIVLSEIATGKRGGKVVALSDVRRAERVALPRLQHEEGCLSNCRPKITSQTTNTCAACCNTACAAHAMPHKNWEEELTSTLIDLKLTRGIACPCVWRGCIKGEDIVATVRGDDITVGGERSAVETPHQNDIKKKRDQEASNRRGPRP